MNKTLIALPSIQIVGIKTRTSNKLEIDPKTAQIGSMVQRYFQELMAEKIPNRKHPGKTYAVYTEYESDYESAYTYFLGEEVTSFDKDLKNFDKHVIPIQHYSRFTTESGPMPMVVINAWQKIWKMSLDELGGKRNYQTDFEVYDSSAADFSNAVVDIFIGIEPR